MALLSHLSRPPLAASPISIPTQFRSFDRTYLLKTKNDGTSVLKVFDISQRCLFKRSLSPEELASLSIDSPSPATFIAQLDTLINPSLPPLEPSSPPHQTPSVETCMQAILDTIQHYKPLVIADRRDIEGFSCPLTLEVLREPVMDEHGHTFERVAIEEHLKRSDACPINRQPIRSLVPNLLVRQTIESFRQQEPIPNFSLFKKDNPRLAATNLQLAQTYLQENEYLDALESYKKAFEYTRDWHAYVELPILFKKMRQREKALLAYLYLAYYQLREGNIEGTLQTLQACQEEERALFESSKRASTDPKASSDLANDEGEKSLSKQGSDPAKVPTLAATAPLSETSGRIEKINPHRIDLLLIPLYELSDATEKAAQLAQETAEALAPHHPEQALALYRHLLTQNPHHWRLYPLLSQLLTTPEEKAHLLLKGACHAIEASDYKTAQELCQLAESFSKNSFIDQLVSLKLLKEPLLSSKLLLLAQSYDEKNLPHAALQAYKMLFQREQKAEYCEKILAAYSALEKTHPQTVWYSRYLSLLMENEEWEGAERVAKQALERASDTHAISLYEKLETIYTHWQGHRLEDLWTKLGQAQLKTGQLDAAEKTYRRAYERLHLFEHAIALAEILSRAGKAHESVQTYYEASSLALLDGKLEQLDRCVTPMKAIDPRLQHLDTAQRAQLLTQKTLLELSQRLNQAYEHQEKAAQELRETQEKLTRELQETRQEVYLLKEKEAIREKVEIERIRRIRQKEEEEYISRFAFGAAAWNRYFGDVGAEPPLPADIRAILESACPFWPDKRVEETHLLVLIPQTVSGRPLTMQSLGKLVQSPREGARAQYSYFSLGDYRDPPAAASHWVLMTKDVLPGSRSKSYADQQALVARHAGYQVPNLLDATVCIFMEHARSRTRLYSDRPWTYTCCQEKYNKDWQLGVGGFSGGGLTVDYYGDGVDVGVCSLRAF